MPLIRDPAMRAGLYPKVEPLLDGLPQDARRPAARQGTRRAATCASSCPAAADADAGRGRGLSATAATSPARARRQQKNTAHGGDASRAIDGNKSGSYGDGGQTHTEEDTATRGGRSTSAPSCRSSRIVIYNRTDGDLGKRLDGFTLRSSTADRNDVFEQDEACRPRAARASTSSSAAAAPSGVDPPRGDDSR